MSAKANVGGPLSRVAAVLALFCVPVGFASCNDNDNSTSTAPSQPASTPLATPAPQPTPVSPPGIPIPFPFPHQNDFLQPGEYGGQEVLVSVDDHQAKIKFACAQGVISGQVPVDNEGRFDVSGTYQPLQGSGPEPHSGSPILYVRYFGYVDDGHLHFDVAYNDPHGAYVDLTYDAFFGNPPEFTEVCSVVSPMASGGP